MYLRSSNTKFSSLLAILVALASPLFSQQTSGNLVGTIYDPTGAVVPGVPVVAHNNATGVDTSVTTTSAGDYRFSNLPAGMYSLTVTAPGFTRSEVRNVEVNLNQTGTANITLQVAQATTSVEVTTSATVAIDTSTAQIQTSFEEKQLADLPTASGGQNNSGVLNLSLLAAGVSTSGGAGYGMGPSVGGQRPTNNNFTIEGVDNNDLSVTGPVVTVPNDAVAEFSMLQNQFSPDFGHSSGGQFNEVVKSGGNAFHGEAYEYLENKNFDAADTLSAVLGNPPHPRFDDNRFGGNFGGPIMRNKLFFFGDYEYNPVGQTAATGYYAPTAAGYSLLSALPGINQTNLSTFQKYLGTASTAAAPSSLPTGSAVLVAPGPGSNESLGTGVFATAAATGALTVPVGLVSSSLPSFFNQEYGVGSVDYNISDRDSLRGRFILNRTGIEDTSGFPAQFFGTTPNNAYIVTLSEFHTFTPNVNNELRLGYNRSNSSTPVFGNQAFPGLDAFPNIDVYELNAGFGPDPNAPQFTIQNLYQITDNVTWTKGKHSLKFGFDGWSSISPSSFTQRARGDYEWSYLSDYLYDTYPDGIAQRSLGNVTYYQNQQYLSGYGNDVWKVTPNLTLNLGVRYEYLTIPLGEQAQPLNASASVPGVLEFNKPTTQKYNFMPRIGIAYSPGTSGKTSLRAGFSTAYDVLYDNLGTLSLPPQLSTTVDVTGQSGFGFLANGGIKAGTSVAAPEGAAAQAVTSGFIPNQKRPESYNWNFGIQHEFGSGYIFETRYVGTRGLYIPMQVKINNQAVVNASNALPTYLSMPSQATLDALPNTLAGLVATENNGGYLVPSYANAGFTNLITAFMPVGNSTYHGWSNQLSKRLANGLQFQGSYTWSHTIDDSTDALNSTVLSPRRPSDSQDLAVEKANSLLDHRNRVVMELLYDVPFYKNRSWFMKNLVGNWEVVPTYTFQSGEWVTAQSAVDSNLNEDSAPDRTIINPAGNANVGSGVTALTNTAGDTVAYLASNPDARYITAGLGALANAGRNTLQLNPINNFDLTAMKRFALNERFRMEFSVRAFNLFNHPQYTGGYLDDIASAPAGGQGSTIADLERSALEPGSSVFQQYKQTFTSNPRQLQLTVKLIF
jgi:hypothetical protein